MRKSIQPEVNDISAEISFLRQQVQILEAVDQRSCFKKEYEKMWAAVERIENSKNSINKRTNVSVYVIIILLTLFSISIFSSHAQLNKVKATPLAISFDKSIHIVFDNSIKYVDGAPGISASVVPNIDNMVKITCQEENFPGTRNVSVLTWDGVFHSFKLQYKDTVAYTTYYNNNKDSIVVNKINVSSDKSSHIIFPSKVIYYDCGNDSTISTEKTVGNNILKLRSLIPNILPTSLFVVTEDMKEYEMELISDTLATEFTYNIGNSNNKATFDNTSNDRQIKNTAEKCIQAKRQLTSVGEQKNGMICSLYHIYIDNDVLFFTFKIVNTTPIRMSVDFLRCFIRDNKTLTDEPEQDTEMSPLLTYKFRHEIDPISDNMFVLAFPKFTIPDKKKFYVQIMDKDGGRHLSFYIKNDFIIHAKKINSQNQ